MQTNRPLQSLLAVALIAFAAGCNENAPTVPGPGPSEPSVPKAGQSAVKDDLSQKDVVKVAAGSADHAMLVKAVLAAEYADVLSNAGPFTVFAPTNAAFDKLPAGVLADLLKPENKAKLRDVLEYHVAIGTFRPEMLRDGMTLGMANSGNAKVTVTDGKITLNGTAHVIATVPASNGIVHVVDAVVLQPAAK